MMRPGDSEWRGAAGWAGCASRKASRSGQVLGEIVAALIGGVDAAFNGGNFSVSCAGGAGFVLDVPEVEVGAVLEFNCLEPGCFFG